MQASGSDKPILGADNNALIALITVNLVVFTFIGFLKVVYYLSSISLEQFYMQIVYPSILYANLQILLHQPWTLFTYNWVHEGFWILLTNMIWLTAFGVVLQAANSNKHLFPIYFYSGILGGFVYILLGGNAPFMGAATSVMAIALAAVLLVPKHRLLQNIGGGIPLWVLGLGYFVVQCFSFMHLEWATIIASFIGASTGAIYIMLLNKGVDLGKWMHQLLHLVNNSLAPKK